MRKLAGIGVQSPASCEWNHELKGPNRKRFSRPCEGAGRQPPRGHRWHRKLFDGTHASIEDMAKSENISPSFVSRILRLAYLSPTIVEAILDGKYPAHLTMKDLMEPFPVDWSMQEKIFLQPK